MTPDHEIKQSWYRFTRAIWRRLNGLPEAGIYRRKGGRPRGDGPTNTHGTADELALDPLEAL